MLKSEEVLRQSQGAMKQWGDTWRKHAVVNKKIMNERGYTNQRIFGHGIGKKLICVAFGTSLENQVENLKIRNQSVDIACVDKAFGYLIENGVKPNFVYLADAGIDYEKWCKTWIDQTEDICLFLNVTANPVWAENWKGKLFYYVNQDNIKTEEIFSPLSGCRELVKASSNVGNSILVHAETYMYYDEYILVGYDFCWSDKNYYCNHDSSKRWYMNHHQILTQKGTLVNTSQNLLFSARWLMDFIKAILIPNRKRIYITDESLLDIPAINLKKVLTEATSRNIPQELIDHVIKNRTQNITVTPQEGGEKLKEILTTHQVLNVQVQHLPKDLFQEA